MSEKHSVAQSRMALWRGKTYEWEFFEEEEASMKVKGMFAMEIKGRTKSIHDKVLNGTRALLIRWWKMTAEN